MSKQWRLIVRCAILGFLVSALIVLYLDVSGEFDASLYTAFAILCPPSLLCIPFSEIMKHRSSFYAAWLMIGLANAGLYAVIGAAIAGQLWKSD
jgi:hypothetical protein